MLRRIAAVLAGAGCYALAFPPAGWSACAWVTIVPLLAVVRGRPARIAFGWGALYGTALGWATTWWSAGAAARYFAAGLPAAIAFLSVGYLVVCAVPYGLFAAGAALLLRSRRRAATHVGVGALWVGAELLRGRALGQPWELLGYSQHAHTGLIQIAALTGVYGVSFLAALGNAALADTLAARRAGAPPRAWLAAPAGVAALVAAIWIAGAFDARRGPVGGFSGRPVAVVQTGTPPAFEWTRAHAERQLAAHIQATEALPADLHPALVVWPENALTLYLDSEPLLAAQLAGVAVRRHADLLFGAPRYDGGRTYNSARLITAAGRNGGHYDKRHLVPFAEASPLRDPAASGASESPRAFTPGTTPGVLPSFVALGVSICHEALYPELVSGAVQAGAELLVNISNDGWLDGGSGAASRQHFTQAVFRAVETRRYLVRAATTGISGIVDPYGRILDALPPGRTGVATAWVAGRSSLTPYVRFGDAFAFACLLYLAALAIHPTLRWQRHATRLPASVHASIHPSVHSS